MLNWFRIRSKRTKLLRAESATEVHSDSDTQTRPEIGQLVSEFDSVVKEAAQYGPSSGLESRFQSLRSELLENRRHAIATAADSDRLSRMLGSRNLNIATRHVSPQGSQSAIAPSEASQPKSQKATSIK